MSIIAIVSFALLVMVAGGFYVGRSRAIASVKGATAGLHSLPNYHGYFVAIWTGVPALLLLAIYAIFGGQLVERLAIGSLQADAVSINAVLDDQLAGDADFTELTQAATGLRVRVEGLNQDILDLRNARGDQRDPDRLNQLQAEQIEALNLSTAAEDAARLRRQAVVDEVESGAVANGASDRALAGYELEQAPRERRQLFLSDSRRIARGELASRQSPQLRAAAQAITHYSVWLKYGAAIMALLVAVVGFAVTRAQVSGQFRARNNVERLVTAALFVSSVIAILTTVGIVLSLLFESLRFFASVPVLDFLFGLQWSPQMAIRADQVGQSGAFGAVPLFAGTAMITVIAMVVAVPIGLFSAIYLSEYAGPNFRQIAKPVLEILAGIPTVVYGFFALLAVGPAIRVLFSALGFESVVTQSALSAGLVMGVMIIPFISSLSDDVINAVPQSLRDGSFAMGATRSETITQIVMPAALPGIVGAILLAVSRAVGETMIVVMAAGQGANLTANPLESVTTITVQIVMLLTGDQEFDSPKTLSAFALGLVLFVMTLIMNIVALRVVQKYREKYD
ncbi:phosphate ABC transporter permease subunit PstC [uncultured Maricaulis sp.]|uniref:phosphate ABC transporter permease subunit PstC n=1 Tax=uncultured Maricaulis sp. TaxID=174710 RepID=UPI0030DD4033|tara:strand:- start:25389 stop:27089 length:1701 start_codon:yes stop_codon:yes gene_type:complete